MKKIVLYFALISCTCACSLTSTTYIEPNQSFELGNNPHGSFSVKVKNISNHNLEVYYAPIEGGKHSTRTLEKNESAFMKVDKNTALIIANDTDKKAAVQLKLTGDLGLSMGYK